MKNSWIILFAVALAGCAHESQVPPSNGHIDVSDIKSQKAPASANIPAPVVTQAYVPPPKPKPKEQTYSVVVNEVPVKEILFALARESKLNIDINPAIQGRVTLNAVDQTLPAILERLAKQVDLTYKMEGNVLTIAPDQPVLRTYKVDYVNMARDTKGFIGAAAEISSTGQSASTGSGGGTTTTTSSSGTGSSNSSRTAVNTVAQNHFWETLIQNIKDILAETDKEVIISRTAGMDQPASPAATAGAATPAAPGAAAAAPTSADVAKEREEARAEFKTLFAANVIANPETGVISVRATNRQHQKIQEFLDKVMDSARRQVLIEATIVEVQLSDVYQVGIDWSRLAAGINGFVFSQSLGPGATFNNTTGTFTTRSTDVFGAQKNTGLIAGYINSGRDFSSAINLLQQFGDTKVLSSPKLMVLNNQTAVLKVVDNLVYFTVQAQQSQGSVGGGVLSTVTTTPNTVPVGVVMSVTPQINDNGNVNLNVRPTISRVLSFVQDPNPNLTVASLVPQIQVREMESMLQVNSGNTAVLGGLMQDEIRNNTDKVPGLSNIPVIGKVFTGQNDGARKTELVIFLRPTVIPHASLESDELKTYQQFLPTPQLQEKTLDESIN
ncbi:MAG TPA: pilus (MSHA type) biogenesis protein MshL [Methylophilaceae bacterium]|nr:pilus (MSHA type) biogenesis protein MshL [Methylophilaceae bacterium]